MYTPSSTLQSAALPVHSLSNVMKPAAVFPHAAMPIPMPIPVPMPNLPTTAPLAVSTAAHDAPVSSAAARRPFMNQTILEIRKVPKENNTVVKISEYFQRFGTIVNIQVSEYNFVVLPDSYDAISII